LSRVVASLRRATAAKLARQLLQST